MNETIQFLRELQEELKTQHHDSQASPRYWTIGDYKMVAWPEGCQDEYYVNAPNRDYYGSLDELLEHIKNEELEEYTNDAKKELEEIACEISAIEWLKKYYDEDIELIPVREEHFVYPNTMFLTKSEAKKHLELNHYHYSKQAHTYAMTAWRTPKVEKLLNILETFDWDSLK